MADLQLVSEYSPAGDQPQAIQTLVEGFKEGNQFQTLLGVTGSGKTFTMANVIEKLNKRIEETSKYTKDFGPVNTDIPVRFRCGPAMEVTRTNARDVQQACIDFIASSLEEWGKVEVRR